MKPCTAQISVQLEIEETKSRGHRYAKCSPAEKAHRQTLFMPLAQATGAALNNRQLRKASRRSKLANKISRKCE